jgi:hypothetical protein
VKGGLNNDIILLFKTQFESNCISLLLEGYKALKETGRDMRIADENDISAQLVGFMKKNPKIKDLQVTVSREHPLDTDATYEGNTPADKSARIDIRYSIWNSKVEYEYYMEAKNIGQQNWIKENSGVTVDAGKLRRRYLETGIANFVSGRYPYGALIGYVLSGASTGIVDQINEILKSQKRELEYLVKLEGHGCDDHYVSNHFNSKVSVLKHFFLNFVN